MAAAAVGVSWTPDDVQTFEVDSDLSTARGYFAELGAEGKVGKCDGASDVPYGVFVEDAASSDTSGLGIGLVPVSCGKRVKVLCGGNISIGATVGTDANGKAVAKTADAAYVAGTALEAGADGTYITIQLGQPVQRAS